VAIRYFFEALNTPKLVFGLGSAQDPAGGAYDAPPDPLVGWGGGHLLPIPFPPRVASVVRPPPTQIPGYAYAQLWVLRSLTVYMTLVTSVICSAASASELEICSKTHGDRSHSCISRHHYAV